MRDDHISVLKQKQGIIERMEQTIKNLSTELSKEKATNEILRNDANARETKNETVIKNTNNNSVI